MIMIKIKNFFNDIKKLITKKNDSINKLRACFATIDFISSVWKDPEDLDKDKATPKKSIEFIREVMGKVNPLYKELAAIIYVWFRHSLVHSWMPDTGFELEGGEIIIYRMGDKKHIEFERVNGDSRLWQFHFNADQFQKDIVSVIDNWINTTTEIETLFNNYNKVEKIIFKSMKELDLIDKRKSYNIQKDFDYIHKELKI